MRHFLFLSTIITPLLLISSVVKAQYISDALRYTDVNPISTARVLGCGSSFGAIGADQSALMINPAGLGLFRKSELTFGISTTNKENENLLQGETQNNILKNNSHQFQVSNLGLVINSKPRSFSNWKNYNYYVGYNKTAGFKQNLRFDGSSKGSIVHRFLENARDPDYDDGRGLNPDDLDEFESKLAYETGAIFDVSADSNKVIYSNDLMDKLNANVPKSGTHIQKGYLGNLALGFGANYKEKLIFGFNIEFISGSYHFDKLYTESDKNQNLSPFAKLQFNDVSNSEITGIKGSLGIIFKPINSFRIGLSWHTPSQLEFVDTYNTELTYRYIEKGKTFEYTSNSPDGNYEYKLITPSRWIASLAYVSSKGLINVDFDYVSPNKARFKFAEITELSYQEILNSEIEKQYKSAIRTRIGLEIPLNSLRLRTGVGILPSIYENTDDLEVSWHGGLGYRGRWFFADFGFSFQSYQEGYIPFATGNSDFNNDHIPDAVSSLVTSDVKRLETQITFGIRF